MTRSQLERFMAKVQKNGEDGCWLWTASFQAGYGQFQLDGRRRGRSITSRRPQRAHIVSYQHFVGAIPDGYVLHHVCETRPCVNPSHLVALSRLEHARAHAKPRTHCRNGHELSLANMRPYRNSYICRACHRENERVRGLRRRAREGCGEPAEVRSLVYEDGAGGFA